jgi:hypothetical protein
MYLYTSIYGETMKTELLTMEDSEPPEYVTPNLELALLLENIGEP